MIKIAVVIPTFNRRDYLKTLLNQLSKQKLNEIDLITIVVVDGSTDGTCELLYAEFPDVYVIKGTGNWWWTRCMNEGFKKAIELEADYVLILNDDTEIKQNYIETLWIDYLTLPKGSILGSASVTIEPPNLIDAAGTKDFIPWRMETVSYLPSLVPIFSEFKGIHPTWTLNGRGTFFPVFIFNKIGFFDEKLVQYGSDYEYTLRARKAGLPVFISWNALVYNHLMLTSEGASFKKVGLLKYLRSFFNPYSINSIKKIIYFYSKYGNKLFLPFYIIYVVLGRTKAYLFKYRKL